MADKERKKAEYRSSIRSKAMIKEALLGLMIEKPFEKISITDIVRRADINRGTFYAHYANTSEVLKSISTSVVDELASAVTHNYDSKRVIATPESFLIPLTQFLKKNPSYYAKLLQSDRFYDVLNDARSSAINRILKDVGGGLQEDKKTLLVVVLDYAISGIITVYEDILLEKIPVSLDDSIDYVSRLLKPQRAALSEIF